MKYKKAETDVMDCFNYSEAYFVKVYNNFVLSPTCFDLRIEGYSNIYKSLTDE